MAQTAVLISHYLGNAALLLNACRQAGMRVWGGENAPYVWVQCPDGLDSWQMFDKMLYEANVVITPGSGFGSRGEGFFRISAFNSRENVDEVCRRIHALFAQIRRRSQADFVRPQCGKHCGCAHDCDGESRHGGCSCLGWRNPSGFRGKPSGARKRSLLRSAETLARAEKMRELHELLWRCRERPLPECLCSWEKKESILAQWPG